MASYWTVPGFDDLYLEDSWVLSIRSSESTLVIEVDLVLRESHPEYRPPRPGEQYCYRRGRISFNNVTSISWTKRGAPPAVDGLGEQDLGSFDEFWVDGGGSRISGDFGVIVVVADQPLAELLADRNASR